jgi:hypothetical protein
MAGGDLIPGELFGRRRLIHPQDSATPADVVLTFRRAYSLRAQDASLKSVFRYDREAIAYRRGGRIPADERITIA